MDITPIVDSKLHSFNNEKNQLVLKSKWLETILGPMLVISDDKAIYLLEFAEKKNLEKEIKNLSYKTQANIVSGEIAPINSIEQELKEYFAGTLREFKTPYYLLGTNFQKNVWQELAQIQYGQTRSYLEQAKKINNAKAVRAVGSANGRNQLSIIIPCHRVINFNGKLGGYSGGINNKIWLLKHEAKYA